MWTRWRYFFLLWIWIVRFMIPLSLTREIFNGDYLYKRGRQWSHLHTTTLRGSMGYFASMVLVWVWIPKQIPLVPSFSVLIWSWLWKLLLDDWHLLGLLSSTFFREKTDQCNPGWSCDIMVVALKTGNHRLTKRPALTQNHTPSSKSFLQKYL